MKTWCLSVVLVSACLLGHAQNNLFFGHYMFNPSQINPGWIGSQQEAFASLQYRNQWLGYTTSFDGSGGAPSSQLATAIVPIKNLFISSVGLNISNDVLGVQSNLQLIMPISYSKIVRNGVLHLGIAPGFVTQSLGFNQFRPNEPEPQFSGGREYQTKLNLSSGAFYTNQKGAFIGLGAINILEPGFNYGIDAFGSKQEISFAFHAGNKMILSQSLTLSPNVLVRTNLKNVAFELGGILELDEKMWVGLSYRRAESIIIFLGYHLFPDKTLKIGYSLDYIVKARQAKAATSHEIFLKYRLPELVIGGRKSVKTPRFTF